MFEATGSPWLVPFDATFHVAGAATEPPEGAPGKDACEKRLDDANDALESLQRILYADNRQALLLIFQAMDAAGKDGTIRAVFDGVDPTGCQARSFKQPSAEELDHDFLWRTTIRLPERGRIGIFNRSYYEEVLVVRVHPEFLAGQRLPASTDLERIWSERFASIRDHELHLARNGTVILKFWLNVSRAEQRNRFLDRLEEPEKNWKFSPDDVREAERWGQYMHAYEQALRATSRPWAPWYAIPADDKPFMRMAVAEIIVDAFASLQLEWPIVSAEQRESFDEMRALLERQG
ncbi:MAG: PPK2 family polyphosphate kinase [Longimicrobiales bacterium]